MSLDRSNSDGSNSKTTQAYRRSALRLAGGFFASLGVLGMSSPSTADTETKVRFENQESDGTSITVAYAATNVDAFVVIGRDGFGDVVGEPSTRINLDAGDVVENVELTPDDGVLSEGNYQLTATLQESNGGRLDTDEATVTVGDAPEVTPGFGTRLVDADPEAGFNYPYFLYAPDRVESDPEAPILVEPNNTGTSTDDFDQHLERARDRAEGGAKSIASQVGAPLVVPVFPRPREDPIDWTHYVHQLDDTTVGIDSGPLERVDLQLLKMVEHAREQLAAEDFPTDDGIMLNGFSASGNFADRFTILHPNEVVSVTAGGLNGMAVLPTAERDGHELPYHVGVANIEELTGESFDSDALDNVNQFLYMGAEDDNDTIPYGDAWTDDGLKELAVDVYGNDMITERFPTCNDAYRKAGIDATFRVYEGAGHTPRPAMDDIIEVHRRTVRGENIDDMGETIVPTVTFDIDPTDTGTIELDASRSSAGTSEITRYLWEFGDGETAVGETVTHEFNETGEYAVTLTAIAENGTEYDTTKRLSVDQNGSVEVLHDESTNETSGESSGSTDTDDENSENGEASDSSAEPTDSSDANTDESVPGFGVTGAISGLGGAVYVLRHRLTKNKNKN